MKLSALLGSSFSILNFHSENTSDNKKNPKDFLSTLINNSSAYLADPKFTVVDKKGASKPPMLCYKVKGEFATVKLTYARKAIKLEDEQSAVTIMKADLPRFLEQLNKITLNGIFDDQLEAIRAERAASLKKTLADNKDKSKNVH